MNERPNRFHLDGIRLRYPVLAVGQKYEILSEVLYNTQTYREGSLIRIGKESPINDSKTDGKTNRTRLTSFGAISIILGLLAMMAPGVTGLSVVFALGIIVLVAGIVRITWAFQAGSFGKGLVGFVIGGLTLICGILLVANPLFASGMLTILLALYFIIDGIFEIAAAMQRRPFEDWGWLLFGGIVSLLLGLIIWAQYPLAGAWAMGILIGIKLFMIGLIMATGGAMVREQ